mmetsp:Transcript_97392/g.251992  ORF Transcript_97392/g.251992 Transcript_97392/m.251992 type:complete len:238 (+) Transcript_97392:1263-1976(+)
MYLTSSKPSASPGRLKLVKACPKSFLVMSSTVGVRNHMAFSSGVSSTAALAFCTASSSDSSGASFSWPPFSSSSFSFSSPSPAGSFFCSPFALAARFLSAFWRSPSRRVRSSCAFLRFASPTAFSRLSARMASCIFALYAAGGSPMTTMATFLKPSKFARDFCRSPSMRLFRTSMTTKSRWSCGAKDWIIRSMVYVSSSWMPKSMVGLSLQLRHSPLERCNPLLTPHSRRLLALSSV